MKANPAFKRVQSLPMPVGVVTPQADAWLAAARKPGVDPFPVGAEFPLRLASERTGRVGSLRPPGEVSGASNALAISTWAGGGRLFS